MALGRLERLQDVLECFLAGFPWNETPLTNGAWGALSCKPTPPSTAARLRCHFNALRLPGFFEGRPAGAWGWKSSWKPGRSWLRGAEGSLAQYRPERLLKGLPAWRLLPLGRLVDEQGCPAIFGSGGEDAADHAGLRDPQLIVCDQRHARNGFAEGDIDHLDLGLSKVQSVDDNRAMIALIAG